MNRGKFIVIEGTDGSGKGTQTRLLIKTLKYKGVDVIETDFPRYGNNSAMFVEKYLRGEYGSLKDIDAKKASLFYALDRYDASHEMKKWLDEGKFIISNRYVTSNMGHQTGKIECKDECDEFLNWLLELEYEILGIPEPDKIIFLHVLPEIGQKLVDKKNEIEREYAKGKKRDIHESDIDHLKKASEAYKYVAKKYNWETIDCSPNNEILPIENIHKKVLKSIEDMIC